ncbi:unnamed protein product [Mesocestoides corti]|uniref:alpha-1,2-Mannosidase n=2 Tax=Mesocestoides corti TaxID=53468 RepID=A0A0R3U256_MESCO|nr:unnamed protein product [Mesocestoides corti]
MFERLKQYKDDQIPAFGQKTNETPSGLGISGFSKSSVDPEYHFRRPGAAGQWEQSIPLDKIEIPEKESSSQRSPKKVTPIKLPVVTLEEIRGAPNTNSADLDLAKKREKVKEMTKHAWKNYVKYAWGHNELKPLSLTYHDSDIFGRVPLGATIVDSIDTLYIMGLEEEYKQAANWIRDKLDFSNAVSLVVCR